MKRVLKLLERLAYRLRQATLRPDVVFAEQARDRGHWEEAAARFQRVVALDPGTVCARVQLGNMLKDSGRFKDARDNYDIARLMKPHDADIWLQLGHLCKLQGHLRQAARFYRRSALIDPHRGDAQRELQAIGETEFLSRSEAPTAREGEPAPILFTSSSASSLVFERLKIAFETRPE